jgi:preprotein translocase subunit SecE
MKVFSAVTWPSVEKTIGAFILTIIISFVFNFLPLWMGFAMVFTFLNVSNHIAVTVKARRNHVKV